MAYFVVKAENILVLVMEKSLQRLLSTCGIYILVQLKISEYLSGRKMDFINLTKRLMINFLPSFLIDIKLIQMYYR